MLWANPLVPVLAFEPTNKHNNIYIVTGCSQVVTEGLMFNWTNIFFLGNNWWKYFFSIEGCNLATRTCTSSNPPYCSFNIWSISLIWLYSYIYWLSDLLEVKLVEKKGQFKSTGISHSSRGVILLEVNCMAGQVFGFFLPSWRMATHTRLKIWQGVQFTNYTSSSLSLSSSICFLRSAARFSCSLWTSKKN